MHGQKNIKFHVLFSSYGMAVILNPLRYYCSDKTFLCCERCLQGNCGNCASSLSSGDAYRIAIDSAGTNTLLTSPDAVTTYIN